MSEMLPPVWALPFTFDLSFVSSFPLGTLFSFVFSAPLLIFMCVSTKIGGARPQSVRESRHRQR